MQQFLQGFGTIYEYIEGQRRVLKITADILNIFSNCKYGRYCLVMVFALNFPFTLIRFCGPVYLKCFSAISFIVRFCHSLFLKRFCSYSCFHLLELIGLYEFKSLTTFSVYSFIEDTMVYIHIVH
jgi:hypothetical protein